MAARTLLRPSGGMLYMLWADLACSLAFLRTSESRGWGGGVPVWRSRRRWWLGRLLRLAAGEAVDRGAGARFRKPATARDRKLEDVRNEQEENREVGS